jgi:hypothetical protein
MKTDWEALSRKMGLLKYPGSELHQGINSSQALEEILGEEWIAHALNTFMEGTPGHNLAIKTLRYIYSPKAAAMAFKIYNDFKDSDFDKANIAIWALNDLRTKESLDYIEEIIKNLEYEIPAFAALRNLIFDHLQWFEEERLLSILDNVSDQHKEDAEGLKNFIKMESTNLLPNLTKDFSAKHFQFLMGTIEYVGGINAYGFTIPIQKFVLDDRIVETEINAARLFLSPPLSKYLGQTFDLPVNPEENYIDASIYLRDCHSPIDIPVVEFISIDENVLILKLTMNLIFEHEGTGFKNEELTREVKLLIKD